MYTSLFRSLLSGGAKYFPLQDEIYLVSFLFREVWMPLGIKQLYLKHFDISGPSSLHCVPFVFNILCVLQCLW